MIIGKSSYEFVEGLCRALIECEDSEVRKVFQSIRAAFDTVEDLEEEASELEDVVLMRVREVRVALQDIIAYVRIGPEALDEAYEKEEIYHQYSDSICY
jgi:hydrogenase maturation factor HypE